MNETKYLADLICLRNHLHEDTGKTLRYIRGDKCVECAKEDQKKYKSADPLFKEKNRATQQRWRYSSEETLQKYKDYQKAYQDRRRAEIQKARALANQESQLSLPL